MAFGMFDVDDNGTIDLQEFTAITDSLRTRSKKARQMPASASQKE